jgi:PKHD-type hydroxylase
MFLRHLTRARLDADRVEPPLPAASEPRVDLVLRTAHCLFAPWECQVIQRLAEYKRATVLTPKGPAIDRRHRNCSSAWLAPDPENLWIFRRISGVMDAVALEYGIDIHEIESLQLLRYGPLQFFRRHTDNGAPEVARRKLTLVVQLSDPKTYVGGSLKIWGKNGETRVSSRECGSAAIFKSDLYHAARPILWGERYSLVAWGRGD